MDFTIALTHFCEAHGPKSVLCTQVLPLECSKCLPPTPPLKPTTSFETRTTEWSGVEPPYGRLTAAEDKIFPSDQSQLDDIAQFQLSSPNIEKHPYFKRAAQSPDAVQQYQFGRVQGETCASCTFSVPQKVAEQLPAGAPGSMKHGVKSKNGAPVLRSREFVCLGKDLTRTTNTEPSSSQESKASTTGSSASAISQHGDCHDHTLTYLTTKSPHSAENYTQLRASVIRALSFEVLPRGLSEGPLCFGDSSSGYTIAYVFRLTDPQARGKRRAYAFVALAGNDPHRAFKACPLLWEAFSTMSRVIEQSAQRYQEETERKLQMQRRVGPEQGKANGYTPISSFLSNRTVDPDGYPLRSGHTQPRSLAEIVGDENIFAVLHQYFVAVLRVLGDRFGGLTLANKVVYQTTADDDHDISDEKTIADVAEQVLDALASDAKGEMCDIGRREGEESFGMSFGAPNQPSHSTNTTSVLGQNGTATNRACDSALAPLHKEVAFQQQITV